jgi:hypothetical protein
MDRFSFLNAAHTVFFNYTISRTADSVEPSWRSFFQVSTLEWKRSTGTAAQSVASHLGTADYDQISEKLHKI